MSKELTPLKAFKKLREQNDFLKQRNIPKEYRYDDELDIIETALKDYEQLKIDFLKEAIENDNLKTALENIAEKDIDVGWLKRAKDLHEYNSGMGINSYSALSQEEYDLLKEILL